MDDLRQEELNNLIVNGGYSQGLILQLKRRVNIFLNVVVTPGNRFLKRHIKVCRQLLENISNSKQLG